MQLCSLKRNLFFVFSGQFSKTKPRRNVAFDSKSGCRAISVTLLTRSEIILFSKIRGTFPVRTAKETFAGCGCREVVGRTSATDDEFVASRDDTQAPRPGV